MLLPVLLAFLAADLTPETASRLSVAWTIHTKATPPNERAARIAAFEATPVMADGMVFVITPFNQVLALDRGDGRGTLAIRSEASGA